MLLIVVGLAQVRALRVFFFFQAEDGIRDDLVTGVQTCALPISPREWVEAVGAAVVDNENEYQFDLGGALPVDRIAIELPELNSVVPAQLLARTAPEEPWRPVTSLVTYRLRQDTGEVSAPPLAVAPG